MKKLKFILVLLFANALFVQAQDEEFLGEEVEDVPIYMNFNKDLYAMDMGNMFFSEEPKAMLMGMKAPGSIDDLKKDLEKDFAQGELKNIKKGALKIKGIEVVFVNGNFTDESGASFFVEIFAKKYDKESCLVVVSFYQENEKKTFGEEGKKAIASAKVE